MRKFVRVAIGCAGLITLAACAPQGQVVSHIDHVKAGDNNLTCQQIQAEIADMDAAIAKANKAGDDASTNGTLTSVASGALSFIPVVGAVAGAGAAALGSDQGVSQVQAARDADDAKARKEVLITLGNGKNCFPAVPAKQAQTTDTGSSK